MEALRRIKANTVEKRLLNERGEPGARLTLELGFSEVFAEEQDVVELATGGILLPIEHFRGVHQGTFTPYGFVRM